ncbi:YerC/YecD family TrpR-related protein [Ornithinimicrobium cryptoxanthini]|uniref:YerC/YecD family TrpR-related protein n=1 Tax=Ornithinimicrobium cryptoxanthini TaxID=2934161 RepID=A0ABY4YNQ0_9MICO|nr:YerC/YecD family TrpR-related protein [Ornithinimicrobium cryptoxanthini]USQ77885.1 YerC/YecD family TrpR-related protein [Ornithinimicrobium cryptoxanthini]
MKRRDTGQPLSVADESSRGARAQVELARALAAVDDADRMTDFLADLCTPAELEALADRWSVVPLLADGVSYRQVHEQTGVSVTTVGRVARCLEHGTGGYRDVLAQTRAEALGHSRGAQPAHG